VLVVLAAALILPRAAFAQATIAGVVRDSSGAVLPGVTVEASSPALTEKVRTVVTDGTGQYRIVTLPPGTYVVKFSLGGFTTVQRETIVVAGSSPLVDTQTTRRETVINSETINALPMTRNYGGVLYATPGLTVQPGVNNNALMPGMSLFSAHGGISTEGRVFVDGVSVNGPFGQNSVTQFAFDVANAQEMQVLVGGGLGESKRPGRSPISSRSRVATCSAARRFSAAPSPVSRRTTSPTRCGLRVLPRRPSRGRTGTAAALSADQSPAIGSGSSRMSEPSALRKSSPPAWRRISMRATRPSGSTHPHRESKRASPNRSWMSRAG
jgi:hypothetical protein